MRPILIVLLDGLGDRAHPSHGGRTANEAARTPNLDALASRGSSGLLWPLGPGRAPSSETAHWAMLGYHGSEFPGRAVFEALGRGRPVWPDEVLAFAALRPAVVRDGAWWVTGRAGPMDEEDAHDLWRDLAGLGAGPFAAALDDVGGGEAILRLRGESVHDAVTDSDPFFRDRHPVLRPRAAVPAAEATAREADVWTRRAIEMLREHPVNRARRGRGAPALAVVTLKWWGRRRPAPSVRERHGLDGAIVAASPFHAGLAAIVGLGFQYLAEGGDSAGALAGRLDAARRLLDAGAGLVLCHLKATDEAGHTKDPQVKLRTIEAVDGALAGLAERFPEAVVCVTGDHATPPAPALIHSGDPVPLLLAGPGVRADRVERFGEIDQAAGMLGHLWGSDLMPLLLNAADRPLFLGSRPTPVPWALGAPADVEALPADEG